MRRKWLIFGIGGLATVLALLMCVRPDGGRSPIEMGMDISRQAGGTETLWRASITNRSSRPVRLNGGVQVTWSENGGGGATDFITLAGSGTAIGGLQPQAFDSVLMHAPDYYTGLRLHFIYSYDADPARKLAGHALIKLGLLPQPWSARFFWMGSNGLLGGKFLRTYDRTWLAPTNLPTR